MTIIYGNTVEPGGMELDNEVTYDECPECAGRCRFWNFEDASMGSVNRHWRYTCQECDYRDEDLPGHWEQDLPDDLEE